MLMCQFSVFSQFVTVKDGKFKLGENDFYFQGGNIHHIAYDKSSDPGTKNGGPTNFSYDDIDKIFKHYQEKKITVVRAWAYFNKDKGDRDKTAFQLDWKSGINGKAVHKLYYVIKKAEDYNIKLIFAFTNFEQDFGGMAWYVQKYMEKFEGIKNINLKEDFKKGGKYAFRKIQFYWNPKIKEAYKFYVSSLLNSYNPLTKRLIKNEPSIMGWDLSNEPHTIDNAESANKGNAAYGWLNEMANFVHGIAPNHLITTGEEGYMAESNTRTIAPYQWIDDGTKGVDYAKNRWIKNIDFITIHAYPDRWRADDGDARVALEWGRNNFFKKRADLAKAANKPLVMEEYGYSFRRDKMQSQFEGSKIRDAFLRKMHQMANENDMAGMIVWQLLPHKHSYQTHFPGSDDYDISYDWNEDGTQAIYDNAYFLSKKGFKSGGNTDNSNSAVVEIVNAPLSIPQEANKWHKIELNSAKKGSVIIALKDPSNWNTFVYEGRNVKIGYQTFWVRTYKTVTPINREKLIWEVKFNSDKPVTKPTSLFNNAASNNGGSNPIIQSAPTSIPRGGDRSHKIVVKYPTAGRAEIALRNSVTFKEHAKVYQTINVTAGQVIEHWPWVNQYIDGNINLIWEVKLFNNDNKQIGFRSQTVNLSSGKSLRNFNNNSTAIYPLPMNNILNIESGDTITHLELVDLNGRTVLKRNINTIGQTIKLNTSTLVSNQVYFLNLYNNNKKLSANKVIKK